MSQFQRVATKLFVAVACFAAGYGLRPYILPLKAELQALGSPPNQSPFDPAHYRDRKTLFEGMKEPRAVVFLGDSRIETCAWDDLLARSDISNRGINGDTTAGVLDRLSISVPGKISTCVLQLGINDLGRKLPPATVVSNYERIVADLQDRAGAKVVVTSIVHTSGNFAQHNNAIAECNRGLADLAKRRGATWVDLNADLCPAGTLPASLTNDGIHLNGEAYRRIGKLLEPVLPLHTPNSPGVTSASW